MYLIGHIDGLRSVEDIILKRTMTSEEMKKRLQGIHITTLSTLKVGGSPLGPKAALISDLGGLSMKLLKHVVDEWGFE